MSDFPPLIYAELQATLRQVSLSIIFPSPIGPSTTLALSSCGQRLQLTHASRPTTLVLPAAVHHPTPQQLPLPPHGSTHGHWRLPLSTAASEPAALLRYAHAHQDVPWEARDLAVGAAVCCRACGGAVVPAGVVCAWKDLPSENWAEMMEFWHCHKPQVPPDEKLSAKARDEHLAQRAYGANATIAAQQGVGFVDLTSFLFVEGDVKNVKFTHPPSATPQPQSFARPAPAPVFCAACNAHIGSHDATLASIALFKWRLTTQSPVAPPSSTTCLAASLLAGMSRSGYSKSILLPAPRTISSISSSSAEPNKKQQDSAQLLHLWIMNPNTVYSAVGLAEAQPAIRLMYKFIARAEADKLLDNASSDVQEVIWPREAINEAVARLDKAFNVMPPEARAFQDWKVSMLDKWQRPDVAERKH